MPRGRPRKKKEEVEELEISEVFNVLEFTKQLYNTIYTPQLVNDRMKDITLNSLAETEANITTALANPKDNEETLREIGQYFEITNMIFRRLIHYLGDMLSFDITFTCNDILTKEQYKSKAYQKDLKIINDFLCKFDYKHEFKKVLRQLVRQDAFFGSFRTDEDKKYIIQELPISYSILTGQFEYGYLFDFNMYWFMQPGVDINMYHPSMRKSWNKIFGSNGSAKYNPSASIDKRNGQYIYWSQMSPEDGYCAFKFTQEFATQLPIFAGLFPDLVLSPTMRTLQKNKNMIAASKIVVGSVPLLDAQKSGQSKNAFAISTDVLGKFLGLVKSALGDSIKLGALPLTDIKGIDFNVGTNDIYSDHTKTMASNSGIDSNLLFVGGNKQTAEETRNSISVDSYMMTALYPMFNNFMNFHINKRTKHKFSFKFEGTEFDLDRANRLDRSMTLCDKGIVLPHKIASALGMNKFELDNMLTETEAEDWVSKLKPIISAYQQSGDAGRPTSEKSGKPISEEGQVSRDAGSNINRGGKI